MHEALVSRLLTLLQQQQDMTPNSIDSIYLINQIIIIFASFSLGSLDTTICLLKTHNLHEILFKQIKLTYANHNNNKDHLPLIESSLRCLANIYTTCQLVPSLIYTLDSSLYAATNNTNLSTLDLLLKVFPISNLTKKAVIEIVSISSMFLTSTFYSTTKHSRTAKIHEEIARRRQIIITSDCISRFANLLTSLLEPVQLSALKFYASVCFENVAALNLVLSCSYYECGLLDLISAYLSRENSPELQLYAAKCLTNMYRTLQILTSATQLASSSKAATFSDKDVSHTMRRSSFKIKRLIRHEVDECEIQKYEEAEFDNEEDYEEEDDGDEYIEEELREEHELELEKSDEEEFEGGASPSSVILVQDAEKPAADVEAKLESLYKYVDASSQLIRRKTLPTLIRLCCTYSRYYRSSNLKGTNISDMVNHNGMLRSFCSCIGYKRHLKNYSPYSS